MPFAFLRKGEYVESPLPPWIGGAALASADDFRSAVIRHAPLCVFPLAKNDAEYCSVPVAVLEAAIRRTLATLTKQGIKYTANSWDCEDFVNELHQTIRKIAALAGILRAPITCQIRVLLHHEFATVKPGGAHAMACVQTESGPFVVESQNGIKCPIEAYPNRTSIYDVSNL